MKHLIFLSFCLLIFTGCGGKYELGDYYSRDGVKGVVVAADDDGGATMIMSLFEASNLDSDSAKLWAEGLEDGWRLPTADEMKIVNKYKSLINITLRNHNEPTILTGHTFYWTSTPAEQSHVYACGPDGVKGYFYNNKSPHYRARAVRELRMEN